MDPYSMRLMWQLIKKIKKGRIILLTTHSMDEAEELGDRIGIMANGSQVLWQLDFPETSLWGWLQAYASKDFSSCLCCCTYSSSSHPISNLCRKRDLFQASFGILALL